MTPRALYILGSIFALLLILTILAWTRPFSRQIVLSQDLNTKAFTQEVVQKIIIKYGGQEIMIEKQAGQWTVDKLAAASSSLKEFFDALLNLEIKSLVSRNKSRASEFSLTEDNGTFLTLVKGDIETSFLIGKDGDTFNTFYMKKYLTDDVYLAAGQLKPIVGHDKAWWQEKMSQEAPNKK